MRRFPQRFRLFEMSDGAEDPTANPEIVETGGAIPPFWDRQVVFVANLLGLFFGNEVETRALADEVGQIDSYGGRLLPVLDLLYRGGRNLLVLEREPDQDLAEYFRKTLALSLPEVRVLRHCDYERLGRELRGDAPSQEASAWIARLAEHPAAWLDGYVIDETLARVAERAGKRTATPMQASRRGNNKLLLHQFLQREGLPVFDTEIADCPGDVARCIAELRGRGFEHAVIKSQIGASGIGTMKVATGPADVDPRTLDLFFFEGPCMVQGWLAAGSRGITGIRSPSVQLFLDDHAAHLYDLTEQILSQESIHQGNESPPPYLAGTDGLREELFRQAGIAATWLHREGFRGTASVDFVVVERPGAPVGECVHVCEINARVTGATYPSVLARHFHPRGCWLMRNLRFTTPLEGRRLLEILERRGHLFSGAERAGVLPINFNPSAAGGIEKGQFLCLGRTMAECGRFLDFAEHDLPIDWEYVRD